MVALLRTINLFLVYVTLGSCIPIPVNQDDPFPSAREKLLEEQTSRYYIFALLGEPASYQQGSEWVYTAPEIEWALASQYATSLFGQQHFLILHFDNQDIVANYRFESAAPKPFACTVSMYCHDGAYGVVRFADNITESEVKDFPHSQGQCGMYLYGLTSRGRKVILNDEKMGSYFVPNSFFFWKIEPGEHQVAVHDGTKESTSKLSVTCKENELIFIQNGSSGFLRNRNQLSVIESSKGRKWVADRKRRLILSESGRLADLP